MGLLGRLKQTRLISDFLFSRDIQNSKLFRTLVFPIGALRKLTLSRSYKKSGYPEMIREYKDCHRGERCFIIGNGPSLTGEDLDRIASEYTFAANKIYTIYDRTIWRPTYYLCMDLGSIVSEIGLDLNKINAQKSFINWSAYKELGSQEDVVYALFNREYIINMFDYKGCKVSENCDVKFGNALTVTFSAIQLAIYMGFKEIYLLGVDFSYPYYKDRKGKKHYTGEEKTHFSGGDYTDPKNVCYLLKYTNENGYKFAKNYCDEHGIIIKNLTRGGKLEVFDRDILENILSKKPKSNQ